MLQWNGMNYWKLSMDKRAFRDTNFPVEYMVMNSTGLYLIGENGLQIVIKVILDDSSDVSANSPYFRVVKLDQNGMFSVVKINVMGGSSEQEFRGPTDSCQIPFTCRRLGVCTNGGSCQCAPAFHYDSNMNSGDCVPTDGSLALPGPCNGSSSNSTAVKYLTLRNDLDYFANDFADPVMHDVSGSCYMIMNFIGSIMIKSSSTDRLGYIKTIAVGVPNGYLQNTKSDFPVVAVILLPSSGVIVIALVAILIWLRRRRRRWEKSANSKLDRGYSSSSAEGEMEFVSIPGLPVRFDFKVLAVATGGFKTQIGSGGFGTVYKGTLRDGTDVAVKKITCLGSQGKREFLTEIAVIGKIHHVNLVKLKGFCAHRGQRFLVYEYMNRGSLDRTLFHGENLGFWALKAAQSGTIRPVHNYERNTGYLAPEWLTSSAISDKTDVYSYGMVLLELIRGKKNSSPQTHSNNTSGTDSNRGNVAPSSSSSGESGTRLVYFPLFALEMHEERRYIELVDPRLMGQVRNEDVEKLVRVALCCVHEEPNLRPSMSNVVGMLEGGVPLGEPRMESLNFLRFYGRRFTEASTLEENMNSEQNQLMLYRQPTTNSNSSYNSFSYMSSQQVSGPR
ncbi:UNVERIFIED_CONTAM: G-type lectin S-receptor-like serine/threonine-protein kinase [Sesamum calycinum]|uniref:G-type lectin S-receptor-like serine/threonine-protein kinase n=1 Tax=Sesamum calycinum TaxID=2727403 RepID=A0AAW2MN54_9LAMI